MPKRLQIPKKMLELHPDKDINVIRSMVGIVLNSRYAMVHKSNIFDFTIPHLGRFKSHGNKKHRYSKMLMLNDKRRKRKQYARIALQPHKLLF